MKSGLGDRNNSCHHSSPGSVPNTSQWSPVLETGTIAEVRATLNSGISVSMESGLRDRNNGRDRGSEPQIAGRLNEVRSWRPEQLGNIMTASPFTNVSMKSGLGDRDNLEQQFKQIARDVESQ